MQEKAAGHNGILQTVIFVHESLPFHSGGRRLFRIYPPFLFNP